MSDELDEAAVGQYGFELGEEEGECRRCGETVMLSVLRDAGDKAIYRALYCDECVNTVLSDDAIAEHEQRVEALLGRAGRTPQLARLTFEAHPNQNAVQIVQEWLHGYLAGERKNLILIGGVGVGKTGLAWPLIDALCQREIPAVFANVRDLMNEIRAAFGSDARDAADEIPRPLEQAAVACLDDLGGERVTDWQRDRLATIIERRYQNLLPMIITSNYDLEALRLRLGHDDEVLGDRIVSRLQQDAVVKRIGGDDRRKEGRPAA